MKNLAMFQNDADCMALLMDGSAALGLDLSFVTHVFLMEPIWDKRYDSEHFFSFSKHLSFVTHVFLTLRATPFIQFSVYSQRFYFIFYGVSDTYKCLNK